MRQFPGRELQVVDLIQILAEVPPHTPVRADGERVIEVEISAECVNLVREDSTETAFNKIGELLEKMRGATKSQKLIDLIEEAESWFPE